MRPLSAVIRLSLSLHTGLLCTHTQAGPPTAAITERIFHFSLWKWELTCAPEVNLLTESRGVGLVGSDSLERLLPGVCAYVVIEGCRSGESSATVSTFERSVAGVRHHMIPQIWWLGEGLGTMATLVGSEGEKDSERWGNKLLFLNKTSGWWFLQRYKCWYCYLGLKHTKALLHFKVRSLKCC